MNEQIKKLLDQATMDALYETQDAVDLLDNSVARQQRELQLEKFAELIIRECITIVDEQKECLHEEEKYWHDRDYGYALAVDDASKGIKQFFGVEE
jgi:hypothetical protein